MLFTQTVDKVLLLQGFVYNLKSAAADCFFYLYTLFCIWIDSYFYCPIYYPHLIPTCLQMISIAVSEQYVLFHYNESIKNPSLMVLEFLFSHLVLSQIWKKQSRFFFFHWKNLLINVIFILYTIKIGYWNLRYVSLSTM